MNSFEPHITVATVVEQQGQFLFVHELQKNQLVYNQPAGHVEINETLIEAAVRETLEETAWHVEITDYIGLYVYQPSCDNKIYYRHCFAARPLRHETGQALDIGIAAAVWFSADDIMAKAHEHRSPLLARCLQDYLSGRRLPLDSIYQHPWPVARNPS